MTCQGCYYFESITLSYILLPYLKDNTSQLLTMIVFWVVEEVIAKGGTFKVRVRTLQPVKDLPRMFIHKTSYSYFERTTLSYLLLPYLKGNSS
jgi:hypothetical protein